MQAAPGAGHSRAAASHSEMECLQVNIIVHPTMWFPMMTPCAGKGAVTNRPSKKRLNAWQCGLTGAGMQAKGLGRCTGYDKALTTLVVTKSHALTTAQCLAKCSRRKGCIAATFTEAEDTNASVVDAVMMQKMKSKEDVAPNMEFTELRKGKQRKGKKRKNGSKKRKNGKSVCELHGGAATTDIRLRDAQNGRVLSASRSCLILLLPALPPLSLIMS